jgi:LCP family protein required for cell wall assembly
MWSLYTADHRRRTGCGLRAACASLVLPGAGQLIVGRRVKAIVLLLPALLVGGTAAWLTTRSATELAGWLLQPRALVWLIAVNGLLMAFRLYATFDAYSDGIRPPAEPVQPRSAWRAAGVSVVLVFLATVTVAPHAAVAYYATSTHGVLAAVFAADGGDGEPLSRVDGSPVPTDERSVPVDTPQPPSEDPTPPPTDELIEPIPQDGLDPAEPRREEAWGPANPWLESGRVTVALLGSDAGPGRSASRIDSFMVATVDTATGDAALFSVDRYLADFPLPDRLEETYLEHCPFGEGWEFILALYRCGDERVPEEFAAIYPKADDPAAAAVTDVLGHLLGLGISHYVMVDMAGFVGIVDALGGVEVELAEPLRVRMSPAQVGEDWYTVDLPAGEQLLDGEEALAFVRVRERDGGDADRMRRQRCLMNSVARTADVGAILRGFPNIAQAIEEHVTTSIPLQLLPELIEATGAIDADRMITIGFGPPDYRGWDHRPDVERIQQRVRQVLRDPDAAIEQAANAEAGDEVCR